jgi:hypothetical protein
VQDVADNRWHYSMGLSTPAATVAMIAARLFIDGGAIELGGALPVNPNGGHLGEAYIHGMNGIAEASARCAAPRSTKSQATARSWSPPAPMSPPAA